MRLTRLRPQEVDRALLTFFRHSVLSINGVPSEVALLRGILIGDEAYTTTSRNGPDGWLNLGSPDLDLTLGKTWLYSAPD